MASKKTIEKKPVGESRGKRGMFLRLPHDIYAKLERMAAERLPTGKPGTMQGTVITLIEQAVAPSVRPVGRAARERRAG
jgi:hypothetical protein